MHTVLTGRLNGTFDISWRKKNLGNGKLGIEEKGMSFCWLTAYMKSYTLICQSGIIAVIVICVSASLRSGIFHKFLDNIHLCSSGGSLFLICYLISSSILFINKSFHPIERINILPFPGIRLFSSKAKCQEHKAIFIQQILFIIFSGSIFILRWLDALNAILR